MTLFGRTNAQQERVNLNLKAVSIKTLFEEIQQQTALSFVYNTELTGDLGQISVTARNETVETVLKRVFANTGLTYRFEDDIIIIRKDLTPPAAPQINTLAIRGAVKDDKGETLPGVTVVLKGTSVGTATDSKGTFELRIPESREIILVFSFIGMAPQEYLYTGETFLNITLKPAVMEVAEIVVTGVFERKADSYTGAITTIKGEELRRVGNQNVLQSLKNLDPSFQVIESTEYGSDPNRMPEIQMRGASNFSDMKDKYQTNPNQPLFVVDGFEQSIQKVMDLDMNRVTSITLLKDATAKALYGSKGANGVVVIETVTPEIGRLRISYNGNLSIQAPDLTSYDLTNASEKLEVEKRAGVYESANPLEQQALSEKYAEYYNEVLRGVDTYWLSKPLRVGVGHKHSLNFEGGDNAIRYSIDFSYNQVTGVMKGSDRETVSAGFTFHYRYGDLLFRNQLSVTFNKASESPYGAYSEYSRLNPYWRTHNEDGTIREVLGTYYIANMQGTRAIYNPLINASLNSKNTSSYTDITNNFYVEWDAFTGMKFMGRFGIIKQTNDREYFLPRDHTSFRDITVDSDAYFERGSYTMTNGKQNSYSADVSANYSRIFGEHLIFANAQWSISQSKSESVTFGARGFANNRMDYITHAKEYVTGSPSGNESLSRETSVLASANYSYGARYMADATFRANASSLFGSDERWGGYWSAGIGWNIHNESFMANQDLIEKLKLRASTGYSGSQNFNSYQAIASYKYYNDHYDGIVGSYLQGLANTNLRAQRTQDHNLGVELGLRNLFDLSFDYYIKNTKNMLTPVDLPPSVGFPSYTENLGETQNKGIEAKINYRAIRNPGEQLYLSIFTSLAHNKNKITRISDALNVLNSGRDQQKDNGNNANPDLEDNKGITKPSVRYAEGQSMNAIWAVKSYGIDPANGNEVFINRNGDMVYVWDSRDQVVAGDALEKVAGTFGFNLEYKGFSVNTSFYYRLGGQQYNNTLVNKVENADIQYNVDRRMYTDRWTTPGVPAKYKAFSTSNPLTRPTTRFVQDLNELQMTSLNIGYDFRNLGFMKRGFIEQLKVQFYANDLFRASTVKTERGTEYPYARNFSFSVQATF